MAAKALAQTTISCSVPTRQVEIVVVVHVLVLGNMLLARSTAITTRHVLASVSAEKFMRVP